MFTEWSDEQFNCWLAGFFDGEGCVYLHKKQTHSVEINISNTQAGVITAIHERVRVGQVVCTTYNRAEWKSKYSWRIRNYDDVGTFLRRVTPFLVIKREQALAALARIDAAQVEKEKLIARNRSIIDMAAAGVSGVEIARRFGVSQSLVAGIKTGRIQVGKKTRNNFKRQITTWNEKTIDKHAGRGHKVTTRSSSPRKSSA